MSANPPLCGFVQVGFWTAIAHGVYRLAPKPWNRSRHM